MFEAGSTFLACKRARLIFLGAGHAGLRVTMRKSGSRRMRTPMHASTTGTCQGQGKVQGGTRKGVHSQGLRCTAV